MMQHDILQVHLHQESDLPSLCFCMFLNERKLFTKDQVKRFCFSVSFKTSNINKCWILRLLNDLNRIVEMFKFVLSTACTIFYIVWKQWNFCSPSKKQKLIILHYQWKMEPPSSVMVSGALLAMTKAEGLFLPLCHCAFLSRIAWIFA